MSLRFIFLISLTILFVFSHLTEPILSESELDIEYFKKNLKILKVLGELKEGRINERVFIAFTTKKMPKLEGISSFTIKKQDPEYDYIYEFKTKCIQSEILTDDLIAVICDANYKDKEWDSSLIYNDYVLDGKYDIINLKYFDENIKQNSLLYIKEDDSEKIEKYIKEVNPTAIEGDKIGIYYDQDDCITWGFLVLEDKNKIRRKFKSNASCQNYWGEDIYYTYQTFSLMEYIIPGKYKIISIGKYILKNKNDKKKEFFIEITEDVQKLTKVEGDIYNEEEVKLFLEFTNNKLFKTNSLTNMYLEDIKTGKIYGSIYKKIEKTEIEYDKIYSLQVFLNFKNIPVGTYYLNYIYKKRKYAKLQTITIKEK